MRTRWGEGKGILLRQLVVVDCAVAQLREPSINQLASGCNLNYLAGVCEVAPSVLMSVSQPNPMAPGS